MLPPRSLVPERDFLEAGAEERDGRIGDLRRRLFRHFRNRRGSPKPIAVPCTVSVSV